MKNRIKILPIILASIFLLCGCGAKSEEDRREILPEEVMFLPEQEQESEVLPTQFAVLCVTEYEIFSGFEDLCLAIGLGISEYRISIYDSQNSDTIVRYANYKYYSLASFYVKADLEKVRRVITVADNHLFKVGLDIKVDGLGEFHIMNENIEMTKQGDLLEAKIQFGLKEGLNICLNLLAKQQTD